MKVKITIEVKLSGGMELHHDDERIWAENEIFVGDGSLILHSNELGDEVGIVKKVGKVTWIDDETEQSEQLCDHPRSERSYIGQNMLRCNKCGKEFS